MHHTLYFIIAFLIALVIYLYYKGDHSNQSSPMLHITIRKIEPATPILNEDLLKTIEDDQKKISLLEKQSDELQFANKQLCEDLDTSHKLIKIKDEELNALDTEMKSAKKAIEIYGIWFSKLSPEEKLSITSQFQAADLPIPQLDEVSNE